MTNRTVREAVGVFHDADELQAAIDELETSGFDHAQLSLLADEAALTRTLGDRLRPAGEPADAYDGVRRAYVDDASRVEGAAALAGGLGYAGAVTSAGLVFATGGALAVAAAVAVAGAGVGGALGAALARYLGDRHAEAVEAQLSRGGLLLWVSTPTAEAERRALDILGRNGGRDVRVHAVADLPGPSGGISRDLSFMRRLGM